MTKTVHIIAAHAPDAAVDKRTISGLVLPFNREGYTNAGPVTVKAGAVTLPEDLSRVKLLRDHSTDQGFTPVGYATDVTETAEGIRMSFKIGSTADGDVALADVREKVRDALSVELIHTAIDGDGNLTAGELTAVALVPIPAFADARVDLVTASLHVDEDTLAEDEETDQPTEVVDDEVTDTEDATEGTTDEDEVDEETENVDAAPDNDNDPTDLEGHSDMNTPAKAPEGVHAAKTEKPLTFSKAVDTLASLAAGRYTPELAAALDDITYSAHPATRAPEWVGQLWDGLQYTREIVPTMTQKPLKSMNVRGWRFKTKPQVEDWEGDKKDIPTNKVETEEVTEKAHRLAAGWDFDRAYIDFGDTEFLTAFFEAAREEYAIKTDDRATQSLITWATEESTLNPTKQPDLLHAAAHARQLIKIATKAEPTAFLVNPNDMFGLFKITSLDVPEYLELLGVDPKKFISSPLAPAGKLISYTKPAVTWREPTGAPIRVSAQHIAKGGIDEAIFGYWHAMLNNPAGIVAVEIGDAAAAA